VEDERAGAAHCLRFGGMAPKPPGRGHDLHDPAGVSGLPASRVPWPVASRARRLRRRVLLWRRPLAVVLAVLAVLGVLRATSEPAERTRRVVVARTDLAAGSPLSPVDLTTADLPRSAVPDGAAEAGSIPALAGRTLAAPLRRGEPLTDVRLVSPRLLEGYPGMVAVPVRVADPGAVTLLRAGDRVDLVATEPDGSGSSVVAARTPVVAVPRSDRDDLAGGGLVGGGLVVVAVPPARAPVLAGRSVTSVLSVVITR